MQFTSLSKLVLASSFLLCASAAMAQTPVPYGDPIALESAKRATAAAVATARANNWVVSIAVVDPSGNLVYFEKMDGAANSTSVVATEKARSAALFKRPTKAFQDALAAGGEGLRILSLPGAVAIEGGVPLVITGAIVGAIGVSGVTSAQDGQIAQAGAAALK